MKFLEIRDSDYGTGFIKVKFSERDNDIGITKKLVSKSDKQES
jgi:hypothetical protein